MGRVALKTAFDNVQFNRKRMVRLRRFPKNYRLCTDFAEDHVKMRHQYEFRRIQLTNSVVTALFKI